MCLEQSNLFPCSSSQCITGTTILISMLGWTMYFHSFHMCCDLWYFVVDYYTLPELCHMTSCTNSVSYPEIRWIRSIYRELQQHIILGSSFDANNISNCYMVFNVCQSNSRNSVLTLHECYWSHKSHSWCCCHTCHQRYLCLFSLSR